MRPAQTAAALALGALLLASCGGGMRIPAFPEEMTPPAILEHLRVRQAQVGTLTAEGKGSLSGSKGNDGSFRWECWAQGTSKMRLVLNHRLKGLLADAVIEGDRAECYDPEAKTLEKGPLNAIRVPGLRQTASLMRLLTGPADTLTVESADGKDPAHLLLDIGGGRRWRLKLDRPHLVYESAELREGTSILARVGFDLEGYRAVSGVPWPMEMTVDQPGEPWKLKLKFATLKLGGPIEPETFKLKVPEGTKTVEAPAP